MAQVLLGAVAVVFLVGSGTAELRARRRGATPGWVPSTGTSGGPGSSVGPDWLEVDRPWPRDARARIDAVLALDEVAH